MSKCVIFLLLQLLLISTQLWKAAGDCCHRQSMHFTVSKGRTCKDYFGVEDGHGLCVTLLCADLTQPTPCCGVTDCDDICCRCTCRKLNVTDPVRKGLRSFGINLLNSKHPKRKRRKLHNDVCLD